MKRFRVQPWQEITSQAQNHEEVFLKFCSQLKNNSRESSERRCILMERADLEVHNSGCRLLVGSLAWDDTSSNIREWTPVTFLGPPFRKAVDTTR